jgi:2',3'-cyclic-nucleotide 2'-phosphodiesterase/3'-nucleotidase
VRHVFLALLLALGLQAQELRLQVLASSDMHGHIGPADSFSLQPHPKGWARLATLIKAHKTSNPNTVLLDCGDTIQGEPVNYVGNRLRPDLPEPSIAIMNALGYHAMAVGNHEFDFGMEVLRKAEAQARFPFLAANAFGPGDKKTAFASHTKVVVAGVNVLVVGFITPAVTRLMAPANHGNLRFEDIVDTARTLIPKLRDREKADVVIVVAHSGLGALPGQRGDENAALRLAEEVAGIDLILTGHTHQPIQLTHKGIPILQPHSHGQALAVAELALQKEKGRWRVVSRTGRLESSGLETPPDAEMLALVEPQMKEADRYLDTFATQLATELDSRAWRVEDTALAQLLHTVMRQETGAQVTAVSIGRPRLYLPKGPTSVRPFFGLLPYENQVARIRVSGAQLKSYVEHSARHLNYSHQPELYAKDVPAFDYDVVDGCSFVLDLTKPIGQRVVGLAIGGQPVQPNQSLTLGITTYRLYGGGGFLEAMGWKGTPESQSSQTFRNLLLAYVLSRPVLSLDVPNKWHTVPYLDRERVFQQAR